MCIRDRPPLDETGPWPDTEQAPEDGWTFAAEPPAGSPTSDAPTPEQWRTLHPVPEIDPPDADLVADPELDPVTPQEDDMATDTILHLAALARPYAGPLDPTDRQVLDANDRAYQADTARVSPERIDVYKRQGPGSW